MTEGQEAEKQAIAVGIGVFIGCIPLFGSHFVIVLVLASLTGLSRVRMYAATWISNPFFAPFLVWLEIQAGHFVLTGHSMEHSIQQAKELGAIGLGWTVIVGASLTGLTLGTLAAVVAWICIPRGPGATRRRHVIEAAAHRYIGLGLLPWFSTRRVLYQNSAIADFFISNATASSDRWVNPGCGRGELLSVALEATAGRSPVFMAGCTPNPQMASQAKNVLPASVEIHVADPAQWDFGTADSVFISVGKDKDLLSVEESLLERIRAGLNPGASLVISWSEKRTSGTGDTRLNHVLQQLENCGFAVEDQHAQWSFFHRRVMIVARV